MAVIVDQLITAFRTTGVQQLVNSLTAAENATDRLASAQARLNRATASGDPYRMEQAQRRFDIAQRNLMRETFQEAATEAEPFLRVIREIDKAMSHLVETFRARGHELLDIQGITGASRGEISGIMGLLGGAGIRDRSAVKMLVGLNQAAFGNEGLAMLGIIPRQGQSAIDVMSRVITKLQTLKDGFYKTRVEVALLGEENVEAFQPLLRMSQDARDTIQGFSQGLEDGADSAQRLDEASAKLSAGWEAFEVRAGRPLAEILTVVENVLVKFLQVWDRFDKMTHGAGSWAIAFIAIGAAIFAAVIALGFLASAFLALQPILSLTIVKEMVVAALQKNWAGLAAAGAIAVGAGLIISNIDSSTGKDAQNNFSKSVGDFGAAVNQFAGNIDQYKGLYMPTSLTDYDVARLSSQMAQGSIG